MPTRRSLAPRLSFFIALLLAQPTFALAAPLLVFAVSGRGSVPAVGLLAVSVGVCV
jgi:hypothetical protein